MANKDNKLYRKANKIDSKYSKKLRIIEEDCSLSDQEKYVTYKALLKKIDKQLKSLNRKENVRDFLYGVNSMAMGDSLFNGLIGLFSGVIVSIGAVLIGASISSGAINSLTIGSVITGAGSLLGISSLMNTGFKGDDSMYEKIATKLMYEGRHCEMALESIKKQINKKMKALEPNLNTEMVGAV